MNNESNIINLRLPKKRKEDVEFISVGCYPSTHSENLLFLKIDVQTESDCYSKDAAASREQIELSDYKIIDLMFDEIKHEIKKYLINKAKTETRKRKEI